MQIITKFEIAIKSANITEKAIIPESLPDKYAGNPFNSNMLCINPATGDLQTVPAITATTNVPKFNTEQTSPSL